MRALTLTQPWAGLVAAGLKLVENRPRLMIRQADFGVPFALHASRSIDAETFETIYRIAPELRVSAPGSWLRLARVTGAVIAVATIERAVTFGRDGEVIDAYGVNGGPIVDLGDQRRWFFGPMGYVFRDVQALERPVPCRGYLGFWTPLFETELAIRAQIARAA